MPHFSSVFSLFAVTTQLPYSTLGLVQFSFSITEAKETVLAATELGGVGREGAHRQSQGRAPKVEGQILTVRLIQSPSPGSGERRG